MVAMTVVTTVVVVTVVAAAVVAAVATMAATVAGGGGGSNNGGGGSNNGGSASGGGNDGGNDGGDDDGGDDDGGDDDGGDDDGGDDDGGDDDGGDDDGGDDDGSDASMTDNSGDYLSSSEDDDDSLLAETLQSRSRRSMRRLIRMQVKARFAVLRAQASRQATAASLQRRISHVFDRRDPWLLINEADASGSFVREFRMSRNSFFRLYHLLEPMIATSPDSRRQDACHGVTKLMVAIRFLAGGSYLDLKTIHGVSVGTIYRFVREVVDAICASPLVGAPKWPETEEECEAYAR